MILLGLDRIRNAFASLRYTNRRAPDVMDPLLKTRLQPRDITQNIFEGIVSLRNRLAAIPASSSLSLTVIELAIAAFAVRVGRRFEKYEVLPELEKKLEIVRKRAKRKTIRHYGKACYKTAQEEWQDASRWIRFNLLPLPEPRFSFGKLALRRQQRKDMISITTTALQRRCTELPSSEDIAKFVQLADAEIRRGRHPGIKVRELIACPERGEEFMFQFIRKRSKNDVDLHVKIEYMPVALRGSMRAEKFETAKVIEGFTADSPQLDRSVRPQAPERSQSVPSPESPTDGHEPSKPELTSEAIAEWLLGYVDRESWNDVIQESTYQLDRWPDRSKRNFTSYDLKAIQGECKPTAEPNELFEYFNVYAAWLLAWALHLESDQRRLRSLLVAGLTIAHNQYKPVDNLRPRMNGVRYIQGICDGFLCS